MILCFGPLLEPIFALYCSICRPPHHLIKAKNWLKHDLTYYVHCQIILCLHILRLRLFGKIIYVTYFLISASPRGKIRSTNKKWWRCLNFEVFSKKFNFWATRSITNEKKLWWQKFIFFTHYSQLLVLLFQKVWCIMQSLLNRNISYCS